MVHTNKVCQHLPLALFKGLPQEEWNAWSLDFRPRLLPVLARPDLSTLPPASASGAWLTSCITQKGKPALAILTSQVVSGSVVMSNTTQMHKRSLLTHSLGQVWEEPHDCPTPNHQVCHCVFMWASIVMLGAFLFFTLKATCTCVLSTSLCRERSGWDLSVGHPQRQQKLSKQYSMHIKATEVTETCV